MEGGRLFCRNFSILRLGNDGQLLRHHDRQRRRIGNQFIALGIRNHAAEPPSVAGGRCFDLKCIRVAARHTGVAPGVGAHRIVLPLIRQALARRFHMERGRLFCRNFDILRLGEDRELRAAVDVRSQQLLIGQADGDRVPLRPRAVVPDVGDRIAFLKRSLGNLRYARRDRDRKEAAAE